MKLFHTDLFVLPLPEGHRFPMQRYRLLRERLEASGVFSSDDICVPPAASHEQLRLIHTEDWVRRVTDGTLSPDELRRIGFPWSVQMVERCRRSTGATIAASRRALEGWASLQISRAGRIMLLLIAGQGTACSNDVAVAARTMQSEGLIQRALVADGDVHQGDGTAFLFQGDDSVRTFSLHAAKAFPARKMIGDIDMELPPGADDSLYLEQWAIGLERAATDFEPDIVYFLAGADPFLGDTLGGLAVSKSGLAERDRLLFELCRSHRWPLVVVMAGGYAVNIDDIVDIQFRTIIEANRPAVDCRTYAAELISTLIGQNQRAAVHSRRGVSSKRRGSASDDRSKPNASSEFSYPLFGRRLSSRRLWNSGNFPTDRINDRCCGRSPFFTGFNVNWERWICSFCWVVWHRRHAAFRWSLWRFSVSRWRCRTLRLHRRSRKMSRELLSRHHRG